MEVLYYTVAIIERGKTIDSLELLNPLEHLAVGVVAQVIVVALKVPGIEGVVTNAVERLLRQSGFVLDKNLVQVLVVAKGHLHLVQAAVRFVHAKP